MADRLTKADPDNAGWHSNLPVAYIKVGDVLLAQGNLVEALKSYRKGLAITERLAKADPDNPSRKRDLVASYGRVGLVFARQGEATLALDGFSQGRAIVAQLEEQFPDDAQLPNQLAALNAEIAKLKQAAKPEIAQPEHAAR